MVDIYADITPVGTISLSSCLYTLLARVYADITSVGTTTQSSCLSNAKINILRAYTQPITAIIERELT